MLMGLENGGIRVQEVEDGDVSKLGASYTINTHDNDYGKVMHLATSFDHRYEADIPHSHSSTLFSFVNSVLHVLGFL